ncbi:MAG: ABC transporter ATP-binding protein [Eubacteriales bacterium]|nr:ABC transporter ATP-binding protein [Eubacteriales bacterium]
MSNKETVKKLLNYIGRYRLIMGLAMLFSLISVGLTLYVPILVGRTIDQMASDRGIQMANIYPYLMRIGIAVLITAALQWIMNMIYNRITYSVTRDIRNDAMEKIQILPFGYLDAHLHGKIVNTVIADVDQLADGLLMGVTQLFAGVATILGTILFMFSLHPTIALIVIVLTPLSLFVSKFIAGRTYRLFLQQSKTRGEQTALIQEALNNQKVVKAFSYEDQMLEKFEEVNERLTECSLKATFFSSLTNPCTRFVNSVVYAFVGLAGAFFAIRGGITVGGLTSFLSYANQYTKPFNDISSVITEIQNAIACASRVFSLIEEEPQVPDAEQPEELKNVAGNVDISSVYFSYTEEKKLIENFNLHVEPGQKVAIVGPTGCGKTTMINLLMRFYDPKQGTIRLDGHDISEIRRRDLRQNVGMVLQETWLKKGTIRDNIAMGKPEATDEEIIQAAKEAHAHSFIRRLPKGYDTMIGEDGGSLSQGQKQLICIARLMLRKPPILILDEATSSIDTRTELKIQSAFDRLMKGKTSFIVAHRLSTIKSADVILVMRDGHIVEQGNHETLLAENGFYANLYNSQFAM